MRLNLNLKPLAALFCLLAACFLPPRASAQTNHAHAKTNTPAPEGNRFLLIVDTSASMKSSAGDVLQAVDDIIQTSASGQMHRGDTFGVWTFNTQLYPGVLPLQTWSPESKNTIAARTEQFLKQQHYAGQSVLAAALEGMFTVIKNSDIITVFIVSTGQSPMQGTPFDDQINAQYAQNLKEMKRNKKPIVTVLQAKGGKLTTYTVNALPWPVVIPEVPIPIKVAETKPAPKPAATSEAAPPTPAPATNIAQAKPAPVVAENAKPVTPVPRPAPAVTQNATPPVPVPVPVATTPPPPAPVPVPVPQPTPKPAAAAPPVVAQNPPPNPAPSPVVKPPPAPATPAPKPVAHTNAPTVATPPPSAPANKPEAHSILAMLKQPKVLLIGAIALAVVGVGLIAFLFSRARTVAGPSLITRTMSNTPKK
jgi:hypothetical protein